jgi:hypothetical protein
LRDKANTGKAQESKMKLSVIIRFLIIGLIWVGICAILVVRMVATNTPINLMTLFPIIASGIIVFVPLYKKYIRNDKQRKSN